MFVRGQNVTWNSPGSGIIALCDITWGQCSEQLILTQKNGPGKKLDGLFSLLWVGSGGLLTGQRHVTVSRLH